MKLNGKVGSFKTTVKGEDHEVYFDEMRKGKQKIYFFEKGKQVCFMELFTELETKLQWIRLVNYVKNL